MKPIIRPEAGPERSPLRVTSGLALLGTLRALGVVTGWLAGGATAAEPGAPKAWNVDFNRDVRPFLTTNCFACHGQDEAKRAKGLGLDRREVAVKPLKSGETAIVPGDPLCPALGVSAPKALPLPDVSDETWPRNGIDVSRASVLLHADRPPLDRVGRLHLA